MLPLVRGEKLARHWAGGCITKSNPPETAANADPTGESEFSQSERTIAGRMKPPAIALEARTEQRLPAMQGAVDGRGQEVSRRRATITPITAGTAAKLETKATEDPAMPATATLVLSLIHIYIAFRCLRCRCFRTG